MELGDLLRSALPGEPAVIRETAAALETLIAQALQVRAGLDSARAGDERADEMRAQLDAEVVDARRRQRIVVAYADRLEVRQGVARRG